MLLYVLTLYIITICLYILVVEDKLQVYCFESSAQRWTSSNVWTRYIFILSCYQIYLYSILEIRVDFCSHFHLLWFTPCHRVIFLVTELATILGIESSFRGLECFCPLIALIYLEFLFI
jgi:hypothetical protein